MSPKAPTKKKSAPAAVSSKTRKTAGNKIALKKPVTKKAAPKTAVKKTAPKKTVAEKAVAEKPAAPRTATKKTAPQKTAAKKSVPAKSAPSKTAPNKTGPKSAPVKKSVSSAPDIDAAYTLPQLVRRSGPATVEEARGMVAVPDAQLITQGAEVATPRINTDCARLYGQTLDIVERATPRVKAALLGVTPNLLRIAVFAAQHGAELYAARNQGLAIQKARQTSRRATAATSMGRGTARREQLPAVYLAITGDEPTWSRRIAAAYGSAKDPESLATSLGALADLGDELLDSADAVQSARVKDSGLTTALLTEVRGLATDIAQLGSAGAAARELSAVSQGEVDLWDGLNLVLLERVMSLVNAARELEPSIPRLTPMSLRTYFYGGPSKKAAPVPQPGAAASAS